MATHLYQLALTLDKRMAEQTTCYEYIRAHSLLTDNDITTLTAGALRDGIAHSNGNNNFAYPPGVIIRIEVTYLGEEGEE